MTEIESVSFQTNEKISSVLDKILSDHPKSDISYASPETAERQRWIRVFLKKYNPNVKAFTALNGSEQIDEGVCAKVWFKVVKKKWNKTVQCCSHSVYLKGKGSWC